MRIKAVVLSLLLMAPVAYSQTDCDSVIVDQTGLLSSDLQGISFAANTLYKKGYEVRVRMLKDSQGNVDIARGEYVRKCNSWQDGNGNMKNNMVALIVAQSGVGRLGTYYGSTTGLQGQRVPVQQAMAAKLSKGLWGAGFIAGLEKVDQIVSGHVSNSQTLTSKVAPPQTVDHSHDTPPVDYSGVWWGLFSILLVGGLGFVAYSLYTKRENAKDEEKAAAKAALNAMANASKAITSFRGKLDEARITATDKDAVNRVDVRFGTVVDRYNALGSSSIGSNHTYYESISRDIAQLETELSVVDLPKVTHTPWKSQKAERQDTPPSSTKHSAAQPTPKPYKIPQPQQQSHGSTVHNHTTIINEDRGYGAFPVIVPIVEAPVYRERETYQPPAREDEPSRYDPPSRDDSYDSGGSSDWGSSDSGSSDSGSSDSGGSSDF